MALQLDAAPSHGDVPRDNLIIEGDSFDALHPLRMGHKGALRCIHIDPPYNTGNRDDVYNDRCLDKTHRFPHSLWLESHVPAPAAGEGPAADDGVTLVSIDDNELSGSTPNSWSAARAAGSGTALPGQKGEHPWGKDSEVDKSAAVHPDHGRVFMVERKRGERAFVFLCELDGELQSERVGVER